MKMEENEIKKYKKISLISLIIGSLSLVGCLASICFTLTTKSQQGEKGEIGEKGEKGEKGDSGSDGSSFLTGSGYPDSNLGKNGDSYLDTSTLDLYHKSSDIWTYVTNISDGNITHTVTFKYDNYEESIEVSNNSKISEPYTGDKYYKWYIEGDESKRYWNFDGYFADRVTDDITLVRILDEEKYYAIKPRLSSDGKNLIYGLYPQSNVNDPALLEALNTLTTPDINGWYLYQEDYYAKIKANPYLNTYTFNNGDYITKDATYWFKCEPITWDILSYQKGEYFIISDILLDVCQYDDNSSNYKDSNVRSWLNNNFYENAFALDNSYILTTLVDNSASSTDSISNPYVCENTNDKIFLPSYQDLLNENYGFYSSTNRSETRYCETSDWCRVNGSYCSYNEEYLHNGYYWTRSPYSDKPNESWYVDFKGAIHNFYSNGASDCVRPCLKAKLAQ